LATSTKNWVDAPKKHAAANGDLVTIDFDGSVGGQPFEGGKGEDMAVELGSGRLIPGFEEQLVGAKAGESRELKVTFPEDYPSDTVKGKPAIFAVSVKDVKTSGETKVDEEFAKALGLQDLDQLKGLIREQQQQELNGLTRTHMKRQLLDQLAARHDFPVPESMVEAENQNIMNQFRHEASHEADPKAALEEIEKDAAEYRKIAERRVRLGLQLVQQEPMFAAQLRAPLYEDKVVDFLFSKSEISERKASRAQLEADLESEEGHVHGPGCGHDHIAAKTGKAEAKAQPEEPAKGPVKKASDKPKAAKPLKDGAGAKAPEAKAPTKQAPAKKAAAQKPAKKPAKKG